MMKKFKIKNKGFTLIELLIAVSLFIVVATISMGALLSIFDANRKTQSTKTVVDNLNLSIENMTRTVRFGSNYYCGISSDISAVLNCNGGDAHSVTFKGARIVYKLSGINGTTFQRSDNGGSNYTDITSSDTVVQYLKFYVDGTSDSDNNQPYVKAVIEGYVGSKPTTQSMFSIETMISQRALDI